VVDVAVREEEIDVLLGVIGAEPAANLGAAVPRINDQAVLRHLKYVAVRLQWADGGPQNPRQSAASEPLEP
jgi:hypothetical protein